MAEAHQTSFLKLTFEGGRFAQHSLPVAVLVELTSVQQLLLEVARALFFRTHADRKRLPRGFVDSAELHLANVEANCFSVALVRPGRPGGLDLADATVFDEARDVAIRALERASQGTSIPEDFPGDAYDALAALGRSLGDDEALVVAQNGGVSARVDRRSREFLARRSSRSLERIDVFTGEVEQFDDAADRFILRMPKKHRVLVPFDPTQRDKVVDALASRPLAKLRIRGRLVLGPQSRFQEVDDVELVDDDRAGDVQKVWDRIASFERVPDGWFDGEGRPPTPRARARAREILARLLVDHGAVPVPKVFPTPDGGVQAEWVLGKWMAEVGFAPDEDPILAEASPSDGGQDRRAEFGPRQVTPEDASELATWLLGLEDGA